MTTINLWIIIVFIGLFLTVSSVVYFKGRTDEDNSNKIEVANETLKDVQKLDEIRSNPPDVSDVIKRLRDGSF
jgi:hypothetical protein